jgi:hypothetical protein
MTDVEEDAIIRQRVAASTRDAALKKLTKKFFQYADTFRAKQATTTPTTDTDDGNDDGDITQTRFETDF